MRQRTYQIAPRGIASTRTQSEVPPLEYCLKLRNRFLNAEGGAEKRRGMVQLGNDIDGLPNVTSAHELIKTDKTKCVLAATADGKMYSLDETTGAWTERLSNLPSDVKQRSVQMDDKLIFFDGTSRTQFTTDGTTFTELKALIERGGAAGAVSAAGLDDADIDDWISETFVNINDLVFNHTRNAYGIITGLTTANATHTVIGTAGTGLGQATDNQQVGDRYEIIDLVELNIIPTDDPSNPDNVGDAGPGTGATTVAVSGVNFLDTDVRPGDYVRNTTRTAVMQVSAVATALTVTSVAGQTAGDSLIFLKSAMPIADKIHVHFGRAYMIDNRDPRKVRISGPNDPQDMTAAGGTLDNSTFESGSLQPVGDVIVDMTSYQRYLLLAGRANVYMFVGTDPIADTSASNVDFAPVGLFPQGVVGNNQSTISIGNDAALVTPDGLQAITYGQDALSLGRQNISEPLKSDLREALATAPPDQIQLIHYQKRSWILLRVASRIWGFNYTELLSGAVRIVGDINTRRSGSWHQFDGKFARMNDYLVRQDQSLICCGPGGKVYTFDIADSYDDDGETYKTEYQTAWLGLDEQRGAVRGSTFVKEGKYIKPIINSGDNIDYTITAEAPFDAASFDKITFNASGAATPIGLARIGDWTIGQAPVSYDKESLRWRGERLRLTFETEDNKGPDILGEYTVYYNRFGVR